MINLILFFPIIACIILFLLKNKALNNIMIVLYALLHIAVSSALCLNTDFLSAWQSSKFFAADDTNKIFLLVLSVVYLAVAIYNIGYMKDDDSTIKKQRHYAYMLLIFVFSMTGAILSTNLGSAWVFLEATTLASAYLIYFHKTKHSIEAAWKYVFICSIGIAIAFVGIILLNVATGNLNSLFYADLYTNALTFNKFWLKVSFLLILFGVGTKTGFAPVHFWLPDAHSEAPAPVSALLSAALLNSAFLIILNVFKITVIAGCDSYGRIILTVMGFLSVFIAAVFIYHINNYKRMLAYSSIENMGIMAIGTALGGVGIVAAIIHLIGHSLTKASFFMTSGNILKLYDTRKVKSVTSLMKKDKKTGFLWVASFVAITAFPPSMLFLSEFLIVKTMILKMKYLQAGLFMLLLTVILYGMAKAVISMSFAEKSEEETEVKKLPVIMYLPQFILIILVFTLGLLMPDKLINMVTASVTLI